MAEPLPIRDGILPELDVEREMLDLCQTQLLRFKEQAGCPPSQIAIALIGKNGDTLHTRTHSWDAKEEHRRIETCSVAAALFTRRAIAKDDE